MTVQEEKLYQILNKYNVEDDSIYFESFGDVVKDILKAFPQITKKPVRIVKIQSSNGLFGIKFDEIIGSGNERQAWIDSHYVEVIND